MLKRLYKLPRDCRDSLFMLLVVAWILLPLTPHLPLWSSALSAALLLWRAYLALAARPMPPRWWLVAVLLVSVIATALTYKTLFGRDAGLTLIMVLLALKTLELHAQRDAFVVFFLGFFTLLSNFFYSQSLLVAAAMLLAVLALLTALINAQLPAGRPPLWLGAKIAARLMLLGAPIMLVLFLLFPRLTPLWGMPKDALTARSGLSAEMQVGTIASLALDDSTAMRIKFEGQPPTQSELYFRGPVLSIFDGSRWLAAHPAAAGRERANAQLQVRAPAIDYQITLQARQQPWLLLLDAAPAAPVVAGYKTFMQNDLQWRTAPAMNGLVRYQARSYPNFRSGPEHWTESLQDDLKLPAGFNPRTLQLAAEMLAGTRWQSDDGRQKVTTVLTRLRTGGYRYTLDPGVYGEHSADEFWFDRRQGFCEHIASSFVILMRALGVPARIVTGYQGGELNAIDGFWSVRHSDAHAWAEVWIDGVGWQRVDPTAAVAPARIGSLLRLQSPRGALASALFGNVSPAFAVNLRALWDAVNNRWNQSVLNYSQASQFRLLRDLGFSAPRWQDLIYLLGATTTLSILAGLLWSLRPVMRRDPWLRLLAAVIRRLQRNGITLAATSTPRSIAAHLSQRFGSQSDTLAPWLDWLARLEVQRYAPPDARHQRLATLQAEFKHLHWPK